ncbi:hypothetical protein DJ73_02165 [Halorubrum sp. Ea1]|uniref:hypothetical protein n=1 Tax=Halorubrum sp. Ea1 TaxID=1480718 RepID=UPI000B9949A7|nr:hypothetical protein [Halorubrum sp. Ea1]OYR55526.1 hypothetical protein DJ73_02165 [Halorubrum sp. Ea1]
MKLDTRRRIRSWLLDMPNATLAVAGVAAGGVVVLGFATETFTVGAAGALVLLGVFYVNGVAPYDVCPACRSDVCALCDRYCATCGARLDELEAARPMDERVDERNRPVGLEEIEREAWSGRSPALEKIADGGEFNEPENEEVSA